MLAVVPHLVTCALALCLAACSGGPRADTAAPAPGPTGATAQPGDPSRPGGAAGPLTREECARFIDHVIDISLAELRGSRPIDEVPSEQQVEEIRAIMKERDLDTCLAQRRDDWECAMAARTIEAAKMCSSDPE